MTTKTTRATTGAGAAVPAAIPLFDAGFEIAVAQEDNRFVLATHYYIDRISKVIQDTFDIRSILSSY